MKQIAQAIRLTLNTHSLWMHPKAILHLAQRASLCISQEQRIRFVSHEIERTARPRYKPANLNRTDSEEGRKA